MDRKILPVKGDAGFEKAKEMSTERMSSHQVRKLRQNVGLVVRSTRFASLRLVTTAREHTGASDPISRASAIDVCD
jgi:hypothetical protein